MKVGLDVGISLVRVLSTGGSFPLNVSSFPPLPKKVFYASSIDIHAPSIDCDDTFLVLQRSTSTLHRIYNEHFDKSRSEFMAHLADSCDVIELRYVRDMMSSIIKRRTNSN